MKVKLYFWLITFYSASSDNTSRHTFLAHWGKQAIFILITLLCELASLSHLKLLSAIVYTSLCFTSFLVNGVQFIVIVWPFIVSIFLYMLQDFNMGFKMPHTLDALAELNLRIKHSDFWLMPLSMFSSKIRKIFDKKKISVKIWISLFSRITLNMVTNFCRIHNMQEYYLEDTIRYMNTQIISQ